MPTKDAIATFEEGLPTRKGHNSSMMVNALEHTHRDEINRLQRQFASSMRKLKAIYVRDTRRQREEFNGLLRKQNEDHIIELSKEKAAYLDGLRKQEEMHDKSMRKRKNKHTNAIFKLEKKLKVANKVISTQAEELKAENSKNIDLNRSIASNKHRIKQLEEALSNAQPVKETSGEHSAGREYSNNKTTKPALNTTKHFVPSIANEPTIAILNEEIKYHVQAIRNLQPKYRPVDCYVRRRIERTQKAFNSIRKTLDEGDMGALRRRAIAMRCKYEPLVIGKAPKPPRPSMQDVNLLLQLLDRAMKMVAHEKQNILERLEGVGEMYAEQHRERIENMFALAERFGLVDELEWVQDKS